MDIIKAAQQYSEGLITFAEFILMLAVDYADKQAKQTECLSCGSDLSGRLG